MDTQAAERLAYKVMSEHGLIDEGWTFKWSRAVRIFGLCQYNTKVIKLSRPLTEVNDEAQVMDTLLHETAHALAGPEAGHGPLWKETARAVGASPEATARGVVTATKYYAVCGCGAKFSRNRLPSDMRFCGKCYRAGLKREARLMWVERSTMREAGYSARANRYADALTQLAG